MAGIDLPKQTVIYTAGQPLTALHLIVSGRVCAKYPGGEYLLGKGDVIGLSEISSEIHFLSYVSLDNINILTYPYANADTLLDLLQKHPDVARLFLISAFRQINMLLNQCDVSEMTSNNLFTGLWQYYIKYKGICARYRIASDKLPGYDTLDSSLLEQPSEVWLSNYYRGLLHTVSDSNSGSVQWSASVAYGFLRKGGTDFQKTFSLLEERYQYQKQLLNIYMNDTSQDLFTMLTTLYHKLPTQSPEQKQIYEILESITETLQNSSLLDSALVNRRIAGFKSSVFSLGSVLSTSQEQADIAFTYAQLSGSFATILSYTEIDSENAASYQKTLNTYKALVGQNSASDEVSELRSQLTECFYNLYSLAAVKSFQEGEPPLPVQLMLYFGHLDEELTGTENCNILTKLLQQKNDCSQTGVYPFYDWLKAIYEGKKEPSRNEYDEDYSDYVHKQKLSGIISDAEVRALESNTIGKVVFELRNMFPTANKMTYGRLSSFCPIFTSENILKSLNSCLVTASSIGQAIEQIRSIDYTLFYRELTNPNTESPFKEMVHLEYLPDVILMPNIGIRGVMWQEIEGKRRATPSRFIFSIFHLEDVYTTMIRLSGEYRWEMCKRIQGYRWNDIATHSLTSEYFDYVQFYRKNRSLSSEAKERIKNNLQRAKNSFKEMFIRDYIQWILFESNGTPRLNKVARSILIKYCPFPAAIRESLFQHPQYKELLERANILREQKLHHLNQFRKKLLLGSTPVPEEVEAEIEYFTK